MKISIVINCDTRTGFQYDWSKADGLFNGAVSNDFLIDGILNKVKFFEGFDTELIVHVDQHERVPKDTFEKLNEMCDTVIVRKHTDGVLFNDHNYVRALQCATGEILIHFDQDTAAFASSRESVGELLTLLDSYDFISYPSMWSPLPVHDDSFDHTWVSTRFFMCKRESLDLQEIKKCFDYDYWCKTYPVNRRCHWTEHFIGSIAKYKGQKILYPIPEADKLLIFSWGAYRKGTLQKLNNLTYDEVVQFVIDNGGIHYPCDLTLK